jgi:transmembrane sensor
LTLANGQQILLDSAHTGMLAQQGNAQIIKTDSGRLAYKIRDGKPTAVVYNVLATPRGGQYKLQLPDGTGVWLNSASSIRYPTAFTGGERKVEITGEAYCEVAKDKAKPFHVEAKDMDVAVLGTHFNINSYDDEGSIRTTLLEGSVKVTKNRTAVAASSDRQPKSNGTLESVTLKPGQQAVAAPLPASSVSDKSDRQLQSPAVGLKTQQRLKQQLTVVNDPNIDQVMAWKYGIFNFNGADLSTVMRQLSRWYDINIKYEGNVPVSHFKGELPRDLTLAQVTSILGQVEVKFRIEGKTLIVMQ